MADAIFLSEIYEISEIRVQRESEIERSENG